MPSGKNQRFEGEVTMPLVDNFSAMADYVARASGRPLVFLAVVMATTVWLVSGPVFGFSDGWQLVANTVTSVITFLMVFLIQNSQNRDSAAIQAKLDELIRVTSSHHELIGIEDLPEDRIEDVKAHRKKSEPP
jgi:low affinity Fe/Cu permease